MGRNSGRSSGRNSVTEVQTQLHSKSAPDIGGKSSKRAMSLLLRRVGEDEVFEALQRPEVDATQTKPHGESSYTGKRLATAELSRPTRNTLDSTWMAFSQFVDQQLKQGKTVNIPHFGRFTFLTRGANVNSKKPKQEPVFIWNDAYLKQHGLSARSLPSGSTSSEQREINFTVISVLASLTKDTVVMILRMIFNEIGVQMAATTKRAQQVRVDLYGVGMLCCDQGMVKLSFGDKWQCTRPGTSQSCRSSWSSASRRLTSSRSGFLGGDERASATPSAMQDGMRNARASSSRGSGGGGRPSSSGSAGSMAMPSTAGGSRGRLPSIKERPRTGDGPPVSTFIQQVLDHSDAALVNVDGAERGGFNRAHVERMLQKTLIGEREAGAGRDEEGERGVSRGGRSDSSSIDNELEVLRMGMPGDPELPIYMCGNSGTDSDRVRSQKIRAARSQRRAMVLYKEDEKLLELEVMKEQSRLAEARLDALTKAASKRVGRLESMRKLKDFQRSQMEDRKRYFAADHEFQTRADVGFLETNKHAGPSDDHEKVVAPHREVLMETLQNQISDKSHRRARQRQLQVEDEQDHALMVQQDMALRKGVQKTAKALAGQALRKEWEEQRQSVEAKQRLARVSM